MQKLLYLKDSEKFWKVFDKERRKSRRQLQSLPFARKIEILSEMQKLFRARRETRFPDEYRKFLFKEKRKIT